MKVVEGGGGGRGEGGGGRGVVEFFGGVFEGVEGCLSFKGDFF